jgi:nitroreductase
MEGEMDYESFMDLVKRRRSYWHFRPDPLPDGYVEKIVDAARYAPSAFNCQLWEFVVLEDEELRNGITQIIAAAAPAPPGKPEPARPTQAGAGMSAGAPAKDPLGFRTAPAFILVLGDTRVRGFGPPHIRNDEKRWESVCTTSLAIAYEHMHLAATGLGLATRWVSAVSHPPVSPKIREFLGIPEELLVYEMMAVGHSDFQPLPKKLRPLSDVLHFGRCSGEDFRTDEQIVDYFERG